MAFCRFLRMINPIAKHILCRWKLNPFICLVLKNLKVEFVLNFQIIDFCFILIFLISRWFSWRIPESFDHTINSWLPGNHSIPSSPPHTVCPAMSITSWRPKNDFYCICFLILSSFKSGYLIRIEKKNYWKIWFFMENTAL